MPSPKHPGTRQLSGVKLRKVRKSRGMSTTELGYFVGRDSQSVGKWESAGVVARGNLAEKVAEVLRCDIMEITVPDPAGAK